MRSNPRTQGLDVRVRKSRRILSIFNRLTGVAAGGGAVVRAEALACARVHSAGLSVPPQLNGIR